ncbi:MAG: AAA family ATPase [Acidobacteria bacterium]|nr:AAA family ATPase [Acidobacteriota bacterium]
MNGQTRVVIVGFMGAGKSAVARELARLLGATMIDLDDEISAREGRTPQQLIDEDGERHFRAAETRALADALEANAARVIALGGGAWAVAANRELVSRHRRLAVWLDAPFDLCWRRVRHSSNSRPFARDKESARELHERRRESYELADVRVRVAGKSVAEIAEEIACGLKVRE